MNLGNRKFGGSSSSRPKGSTDERSSDRVPSGEGRAGVSSKAAMSVELFLIHIAMVV